MKIRILRPAIWTDFNIARLSPTSMLLYLGALSYADDAGIIPLDPAQVKFGIPYINGHLTVEQVQQGLDEMLALGLGHDYEHGPKRYLILTDFVKDQQIRKTFYQYPAPDGEEPVKGKYPPGYSPGYKVTSEGISFVSQDNKVSPQDSETESQDTERCSQEHKEKKRNEKKRNEKIKPQAATVYTVPLRGGETYEITTDDIKAFRKLYPLVDIGGNIERAIDWLQDNPSRAKSDGKRFIKNWLGKRQEQAEEKKKLNPAWQGSKPVDNRPLYTKGVPLNADPLPLENKPLFEDWEGANSD